MTDSNEAARKGWHVTASKSRKKKTWTPLIKHDETTHFVGSIQNPFDTEGEALAAGEAILNARYGAVKAQGTLDAAEAAGYRRGHSEGHATGKSDGAAESFQKGRTAGLNSGSTQGAVWGVAVTAILLGLLYAAGVLAINLP